MMRHAPWVTLAAIVSAFAIHAERARAHGPCSCLFPALGAPDTRVSITRTPAYRVLFNPKPGQFGIAPGDLASAHRPDSPTLTMLTRRRDRPIPRASFRIPDVSPGLYMVLIFDGEEGGAHNTWDYLHVLGPARATGHRASSRAPGSSPPASSDGTAWLAWLAGGIALGAGGTLLYRRVVVNRHR